MSRSETRALAFKRQRKRSFLKRGERKEERTSKESRQVRGAEGAPLDGPRSRLSERRAIRGEAGSWQVWGKEGLGNPYLLKRKEC